MRLVKILVRITQIKDFIAFVIDLYESCLRINSIRKRQPLHEFTKVRISVKRNAFNENIRSQSKNGLGIVNKTLFVTTICTDVNVVINRKNFYIPMLSKTNENWLVHIEPPGYLNKLGYNSEKLHSKFSRIYTSDPVLYEKGGKYIASPPYVHWHVDNSSYTKNILGNHDYDFLKKESNPPYKDVDLVVINSNINDLPGHKLRAKFIQELCKTDIDFKLYGGSKWSNFSQYVDDAPLGKWPIYSRSRYVLVIENEVSPYYWSEKLTDAILCWGMPIYYGSPKIGEYMPKGSYIAIDINSDNSIQLLRDILNSSFYEDNIDNLREARSLILEKFNLLAFIDSEIRNTVKIDDSSGKFRK